MHRASALAAFVFMQQSTGSDSAGASSGVVAARDVRVGTTKDLRSFEDAIGWAARAAALGRIAERRTQLFDENRFGRTVELLTVDERPDGIFRMDDLKRRMETADSARLRRLLGFEALNSDELQDELLLRGLRIRETAKTCRVPDVNLEIPVGQRMIAGLKSAMTAAPAQAVVVDQASSLLDFSVAIADRRESANHILGSACYLGDGYFVTAAHVIQDCRFGAFVIPGRFASGDIQPEVVFEVDRTTLKLATDSRKDIVVFKTKPTAGRRYADTYFVKPAIAPGGVYPTALALVRIVGYPRGSCIAIASENARVVGCDESWSGRTGGGAPGDIGIIGGSWAGFSGAPIIEHSTGAVVGIVVTQPSADEPTSTTFPISFENCLYGVHIRHVPAFP